MTLSKLALSACSVLILAACSNADPVNERATPQAEARDIIFEIDANIKRLTNEGLDSSVAYDVVESLTTEIGPRLAGSEAEARAREWGVAKFKELGFENVRIEPFTIPAWERGVETAEILTPYPQTLYITSLGGSVATQSGGVTAEVAYYPTFEALENAPLDDALSGKIVYISGLMEKAHDGAGYGPANRKRRSGATEAAKRGAAAVLIRSVGTDSHRFPHTGQMGYATDGTPKIPIAAMSGPDADQMDRIFESGQTMTLKMELGPRSVGDRPSGNVIGEIVGSEKPEEIVLIGGHLDSWDLGTGAVDDGAGIGITVGAAKVLMESGLKPKRTIRIVMFGAEETGLWGGRFYAKQNEADLANHIVATESDFGAGPVYEVRPGTMNGNQVSPATVPFAQAFQKQIAHLDIAMGEKPSNGGPDIGAMNSMGVPTIRLQQDGYDYFDLHHTPDDTLDKIDPAQLAQNVAAYAAFIWFASETGMDLRNPE